jgi:isopropylmalate/homocitrate/citramalate synthase
VNGNQGHNYAIVDPPDEGRDQSLIGRENSQGAKNQKSRCRESHIVMLSQPNKVAEVIEETVAGGSKL